MFAPEHDLRVLDLNATLAPDQGDCRPTPVERLERECRAAGVVRAAVAPPPGDPTTYLRANNAVARLAVSRPFLAVARLAGPRDPGASTTAIVRNLTASRADHHPGPDDVRSVAHDGRFHAVRLAPARDGLPDAPTLDALAETGLPALVRTAPSFSPEAAVEAFVARGVPTVLESMGGSPLDRQSMEHAVDLLDDHENLWLGTARVPYRGVVERAVQEHPDRVTFGSGAPDPHPTVAVTSVRTLDVPENLLRRVVADNPARVVPALGSDR
jgi:predicted TIM-barrel fold metal-dependent hydrolase